MTDLSPSNVNARAPALALGERYHPLSIGAHWLTLILLVAVYALIELRGIFPKGSAAHDAMKTWHFMLGLTVFGLTFARLAARGLYAAPAAATGTPAWQHVLTKTLYLTLYLFLLVMPLLGWLTLSAKGKPIPFFGLDLPALIAPDKPLGRNLQNIHETIGTLGYYLIGAHAFAALFHHYILRDGTLRRMWLARAPSRTAPD